MYLLRTLGGLSLERQGRPVEGLANQRKALALLALIGASCRTGISRDKAMAFLWPESRPEQARASLKQVLHLLRRHLGTSRAVLGVSELRLNPEQITTDVDLFHSTYTSGDLQSALRMYAGPFLDGVHVGAGVEFEQWIDAKRGELAARYGELLERLARDAEGKGDHRGAVAYWHELQLVDPLSGRAAVGLMGAWEALGERAAALRVARAHETRMREELGSAPHPAVAALANRLRASDEAVRTLRGEGGGGGTFALARRGGPTCISETTNAGAAAETHLLTAPAVVPGKAARAAAKPAKPATRATQPWRSRYSFVVLTASTALALLASTYRERGAAPLEPRRVAVALLQNRTGDSTLDAVGNMASDWIVRGIARTSGVDVVDAATLYTQGRTRSGGPTDPVLLARQNGAGYVIAGNYYKAGDSLHFHVNLVDAATGRVLHTLVPARASRGDVISAIEELRQRVATALAAQFHPQRAAFSPDGWQPPTLAAYEEFVSGQDLYWRGEFEDALMQFRRAADLDTSFIPARRWVALTAVGMGRCDVVDSIDRSFRSAGAASHAERLALRAYMARCHNDWDEVVRLAAARAPNGPRPAQASWGSAAALRRARRPADALALLARLDPTTDLGWISDKGKVLYWREVAGAHHVLGNHAAEQAAADQIERSDPDRLSAAYIKARGLAAGGADPALLDILERVPRLAPDPAMVAGEMAWGLRPDAVGTAGWVLYQIATELRAHGDPAAARHVAERAVLWYERGAGLQAGGAEHRLTYLQALVLAERYHQAMMAAIRFSASDSLNVELRGMVGIVAALLGDRATVDATDAWLAARPPQYSLGVPVLYRARIAAASGDDAMALTLLETLPFGAHPADPVLLHSDPAFHRLLPEPRFRALLHSRDRGAT